MTSKEIALLLKEKISQSFEYKNYLINKEIYENCEEIINLKKEIVRAKNENRLQDFKILKNKFDSFPLVINYLSSKKEYEDLLSHIASIIKM